MAARAPMEANECVPVSKQNRFARRAGLPALDTSDDLSQPNDHSEPREIEHDRVTLDFVSLVPKRANVIKFNAVRGPTDAPKRGLRSMEFAKPRSAVQWTELPHRTPKYLYPRNARTSNATI